MNKLQVIYGGWGERWLLGTLLDAGGDILFEYSAAAIERGLQLSPYSQPLPLPGAAVVTYRGKREFYGLPGFIADALPDGWGMLLMDRALRRAGRKPQAVSVLERLAIVGDRAIGALAFEPAEEGVLPAEKLQLASVARDVAALQADDDASSDSVDVQLRHLMQLGGSPQGARPKVLADFDTQDGRISSGMPLSGAASPWLFKFPAAGEHREVCALEALYARLARAGTLQMPDSRFFDLGAKHSAFGVQRFDRVLGAGPTAIRVPMLSLSAYLEADHRLPSLDYETLLSATRQITGDQREVMKAFGRCVFNVLMHNRDDHSRNFAYVLNEQGRWQFSPAFDLTLSDGPGGEHSTSVAGHGKDITRQHLLTVAETGGIAAAAARQCIDHWLAMSEKLADLVDGLPIRRNTLNELHKSIGARVSLLA